MTSKKIDFDKNSFEDNGVMDTRYIKMYNDAIKEKELLKNNTLTSQKNNHAGFCRIE
jgi:hypothetical protein